MSSRSFRRRNNRRRHHPGPGGEAQGQISQGSPEERSPQGAQGRAPAPQEKRSEERGKRDGTRGQQRGGGARAPSRGERKQGGRAGAPQDPETERPPRRQVPLVVPECPVCGKQVRDLSSALTHRASRQPAHFDCIVKELRESHEVGPDEKLCYLGGGAFGILEFSPPGGPSRFVIKRRIPYEEKEAPQDWKKPLQVIC